MVIAVINIRYFRSTGFVLRGRRVRPEQHVVDDQHERAQDVGRTAVKAAAVAETEAHNNVAAEFGQQRRQSRPPGPAEARQGEDFAGLQLTTAAGRRISDPVTTVVHPSICICFVIFSLTFTYVAFFCFVYCTVCRLADRTVPIFVHDLVILYLYLRVRLTVYRDRSVIYYFFSAV